jgi:hypothetical protein
MNDNDVILKEEYAKTIVSGKGFNSFNLTPKEISNDNTDESDEDEYTYDPDRNRYRSKKTGRFVSKSNIKPSVIPISRQRSSFTENFNVNSSFGLDNNQEKTERIHENSDNLSDTIFTIVAILNGISNTLSDQLNNDKLSEKDRELQSREREIEANKKNKSKSAIKINNEFNKGSGSLGGLLLAAGLLGASSLDKKKLDEIGTRIEKFKEDYKWVLEIGPWVAGGALAGSIVPGVGTFIGALAGGIIGLIRKEYPSLAGLGTGAVVGGVVGATLGSVFPGVGTVAGGAGGAAIGGSIGVTYDIEKIKNSPRPTKGLQGWGADMIDIIAPGYMKYKENTPTTDKPSDGVKINKATSSTEDSKQNYILKYLMERGQYTREQASGIIGNLYQESRLDHTSDNGLGYHGIAQWGGSRLKDFKEKYGKEVLQSSLQEQLDFLIHELKGKYKKVDQKIKASANVKDSSLIFRKEYEKPGEHEAMQGKRDAYAQSVYEGNKLEGTNTSNVSDTSSSTNEEETSTTFDAIIQALKTLPNTDTKYKGSIEDITKQNIPKYIGDQSTKLENLKNYGRGDTSTDTVQSSPAISFQNRLSEINGGVLDVINPNYNMSGSFILSNYLNFFDVLPNKSMVNRMMTV